MKPIEIKNGGLYVIGGQVFVADMKPCEACYVEWDMGEQKMYVKIQFRAATTDDIEKGGE